MRKQCNTVGPLIIVALQYLYLYLDTRQIHLQRLTMVSNRYNNSRSYGSWLCVQ